MEWTIEYYDNGGKKEEGLTNAYGKQGPWRCYYQNGAVLNETTFRDNKKNGRLIVYYENGKLSIEGYYEDGILNGIWREYYEDGSIKEETLFENSEYRPINFWDENGNQLMANGTGKKIEKYGTYGHDVYEQYFENGVFIKEIKIGGIIYGGFISIDDATKDKE